jgi:hypothetical protein
MVRFRVVPVFGQYEVASGACGRHVNPADGVGSLKHGRRTHSAHAEGTSCIRVSIRDGQNGNPGQVERNRRRMLPRVGQIGNVSWKGVAPMSRCRSTPSRGMPPSTDGPGSKHFRGGRSAPHRSGMQDAQPPPADHETPMPWGTNVLVAAAPDGEIPRATVAKRILDAINAHKGE